MTPFVLREPAREEAAALAELLNTHSRNLHGEPDLSADELDHWFGVKDIWIRVAERAGRLVAYVDVANDEQQGRRFHVDARALDEAAAHSVVAAAEEHARRHAVSEAILRGYAAETDRPIAAAYEAAGLRIVRHSFQMRIELDAPPSPGWPPAIRLRSFDPADEEAVWLAMNETFVDHWGYQPPGPEGRAEWRHYGIEGPHFDPALWFLAEDGNALAGISLCQWHASGDPQFGWVQTLGVRRPWRRRGLALALLQHSFAEFARRGATRVGLGVDAENTTNAVRLYERAGMSVVRRSDTWEKTL